MDRFKKVLLTSFLVGSKIAWAGGWTSGGGELIRDSHNPWFLANTPEVSYCIKIDEKEFGQPKEFVRERIQKAFRFWKLQLGELFFPAADAGGISDVFKLGTQNFREVSCGKSTDVVFQFASLTAEQKDRMGDLTKTVAVSVRTDYDKVNLKGRGFIFFNRNESFPILPWSRSNGSRLLPIMIHELGHLFGLEHTKEVTFMSEDYAEGLVEQDDILITDNSTEFMNRGENIFNFHLFTYHPFSLYEPIGFCVGEKLKANSQRSAFPVKSIYNEFFGIPKNAKCQSDYIKDNKFLLYAGDTMHSLWGQAEVVRQDLENDWPFYSHSESIISFWLPPEQTIYCPGQVHFGECQLDPKAKSSKIAIAFFFPKQFFKGTFTSVDGKIKREVFFEVWNSGWISRTSGIFKGKLYNDLNSGF